MPPFEEVCKMILRSHGALRKLALGGVLSFIPVVNLFALGYIYRYTEQVRTRNDFELPEWDSWDGLFYDGIRVLLLGLAFCVCPILLVKILIFFMGLVLSDYVEVIKWMIMMPVLLVLPMVGSFTLFQFQRFEDWHIFADFPKWIPFLRHCAAYFILPTFTLFGLWILCLPMYGFAVFIGLLFYLSYGMLAFSTLSKKR